MVLRPDDRGGDPGDGGRDGLSSPRDEKVEAEIALVVVEPLGTLLGGGPPVRGDPEKGQGAVPPEEGEEGGFPPPSEQGPKGGPMEIA